MSKNFSASTGGPWSIGVPDPLKDLPSISMLIGILSTSFVNSQWVFKLSMPDVPSKICQSKEKLIYLDNGSLSCNFKDLALAHASISETDVHDLSISKN